MVEVKFLIFFHVEKIRSSVFGRAPVQELAVEEMVGVGNGA